MKLGKSVMVASILAVLSLDRALAQETSDYGVDRTVTDAEAAEGAKFGGFPNNRFFNNETPCRAIVRLFDKAGMGPDKPEMVAFLRYYRFSLMTIDIATSVMTGTPQALPTIGSKDWSFLPALAPSYCRKFPKSNALDSVAGVYRAARVSHGMPPGL